MILMCKNHMVYDTDTEFVYNHNLLSGYMRRNPCKATFKAWVKFRYSSNTNILARKLKGITFGQGNRAVIDEVTHMLSLSDCYWVRGKQSSLTFEMVSPYFQNFWKGEGTYSENQGLSIPTLYVGGYLPKEWFSARYLYKYGDGLGIEEDVSLLCKACKIPVCSVERILNGVRVENFTSPTLMLEQANQSGLLDPDDFNEDDIIKLFGLFGAQMLIIDAITGNGDRHAGNFGWLKSSNTGKYISPAPLYDFDHALDSKLSCDRLIEDAVSAMRKFGYIQEAIRICNTVLNLDTAQIFKLRTTEALKLLYK